MAKFVTLKMVEKLKRSNVIVEIKMAELKQNNNSKQPDRKDALWKPHFTLEINQ